MTGLGNDLIALKTTDDARTKSPRFYSKILAAPEQQLYQNQFAVLPFEHFVWLLWSVKEAAYKALQRYQPDLVFTPVKVEIIELAAPSVPSPAFFSEKITTTGFNQEECFKSIIRLNNQLLYARSIIYSDELIHTVAAATNDFDKIHWGVKRIEETNPASQSAAVREFLLQRLGLLFPDVELSVEKSPGGYPFITADEKVMDVVVSLSHHEGFAGYALR